MKNVLIMTEEEKMLLIDRADKWLEAYPALRASVTSWQDAPVKDFDEGLLLCSCLRRAKSFVESAYKFNAQKCLDMIQMTLKEIVSIAGLNAPRTESEKKAKPIKAFVPKNLCRMKTEKSMKYPKINEKNFKPKRWKRNRLWTNGDPKI